VVCPRLLSDRNTFKFLKRVQDFKEKITVPGSPLISQDIFWLRFYGQER
jgi:hypothetical protein